MANITTFVDECEMISGGGLLQRAQLTFGRKHHVVDPESYIGNALVGDVHSVLSLHQGRVITVATLRDEECIPMGG